MGPYLTAAVLVIVLAKVAYLYWKHVWFFRNPPRVAPSCDCVLSPADGTVVYARVLGPADPVVCVKAGVVAHVEDLTRRRMHGRLIHVGIFMSPFDVHFNRAPFAATVDSVTHYPGCGENRSMFLMHLKTLLAFRDPARGSAHILQNERTVTTLSGVLAGTPISCSVVQIASRSVSTIESYVSPRTRVTAGQVIGLIRHGSQVDVSLSLTDAMVLVVRPGDRVRAGESVLVLLDNINHPGHEEVVR